MIGNIELDGQPFLHFRGRLLGESHRADLIDGQVILLNAFHETANEHGRLTGTGRRGDDDILTKRINNFELLSIMFHDSFPFTKLKSSSIPS